MTGSRNTPIPSPDELRNVAIEAAEVCGSYLGERYREPKGTYEEKSPGDLVSETDRESQRLAREVLMRRTPGAFFLAEEDVPGRSEQAVEADGLVWIVDPLDGTANFLHRFPMFAISIAAARGRTLEAAAVLNPASGELFSAARNGGATLNGEAIFVSGEDRLDRALLATGWPFRRRELIGPYLEVFARVLDAAQGMRRPGAASLDLCYTAAGRLEGFWEFGLSIWDVAAGALIVAEAGGRISDFAGSDGWWESGDIVATNGRIHDRLLESAATPGGIAELFRKAGPDSK